MAEKIGQQVFFQNWFGDHNRRLRDKEANTAGENYTEHIRRQTWDESPRQPFKLKATERRQSLQRQGVHTRQDGHRKVYLDVSC